MRSRVRVMTVKDGHVLAARAPDLPMDPITEPAMSGLWERLGVAGIIVVAAFFLLRYFMQQLDKKDSRVTDLTDRFLKSTQEQTLALAQNTEALRELKEAVRR